MSPTLELPIPVSLLLHRFRLTKATFEQHDLALRAWEASVRLAVAVEPFGDVESLKLPSLGDWVEAFSPSSKALLVANPALLELHSLFAEVITGEKATAQKISVRRILEGLPAYRNKVMGHGATRPPRYYERAALVLQQALLAAWGEDVFLADGTEIVYVDSVELDSKGRRHARLLRLMGLAPTPEECSREIETPPNVLPRRVYAKRNGAYRSLHPLIVFRPGDILPHVLFFNGMSHAIEYLDYVDGALLHGRALRDAFPTLEAEVRSFLKAPQAGAQTEAQEKQQAARPRAFRWRWVLSRSLVACGALVGLVIGAPWIYEAWEQEPPPIVTKIPRQVPSEVCIVEGCGQPRVKPDDHLLAVKSKNLPDIPWVPQYCEQHCPWRCGNCFRRFPNDPFTCEWCGSRLITKLAPR